MTIITDANHALAAMSDIVANISAPYGDDSEDIYQSIFLAVFKYLHDHGPTELPLLIVRAQGAAKDEINQIRSHGFRPLHSELEPIPRKVNPAWVHGTTDVDPEIDTPAAKEIPESSTDLLEHLRALASEPDEIKLVEAGHRIALASANDAKSVSMGTCAELMRFSGMTKARVLRAQQSLMSKYILR